jgi:hypothetical protein
MFPNQIIPRTRKNQKRKQNYPVSVFINKAFNAGGQMPTKSIERMLQPQCCVHLRNEFTNFNTSTIAEVRVGYSIRLSDFPNYSNWTACFDEYRIEECEFWVIPAITESTTGAPQTGRYVGSIDLDDASAFSSFAAHLSADDALVTGVTTGQYQHFVPRLSSTCYNGAVASGYSSAARQWIDTSTPSVNHYGVKYSATATGTAMNLVVEVRMKVSFRGSRAV